MLGHTSDSPQVFGLYSRSVFALLLVYGSGYLLWVGLLTQHRHASALGNLILYIQEKVWLVLAWLIFSGVGMWLILSFDRIASFTSFRARLVALILLGDGVVIFAGWQGQKRVQLWRKIVVALLAVVMGVEGLAQGPAFAGALPGSHRLDGRYSPYGRVYSNMEGLGNGITNNYG